MYSCCRSKHNHSCYLSRKLSTQKKECYIEYLIPLQCVPSRAEQQMEESGVNPVVLNKVNSLQGFSANLAFALLEADREKYC